MKIKTLTLTDFRAFPGPSPATFELAGKNLLVYGENGSGKSSIFHALREFFTFRPSKPLRDYKNIYSGESDAGCRVEVTFNDAAPPATWTIAGHPCLTANRDQRVSQAALRRSCLDYRALLDTNYKHVDGTINLFGVAVNSLVHDLPFSAPGSTGSPNTVGDYWQAVQQAKPSRHNDSSLRKVNEACALFNAAFNQALTSLHPFIGVLLSDLIGTELEVAPFVFGGVTYNREWEKRLRGFNGCQLTPQVTFRNQPMAAPHHFLNEARLSALGLAIYLAGRLACIPHTTPEILKLLVLDDVLIGLDHSNRLPVLDVLEKHFQDWQIILLTHDRLWYETVKIRGEVSDGWRAVELYASHDADAKFAPRIEPVNGNIVKDYLRRAEGHLAGNDLRAAAVYARSAFEVLLKKFCHKKGIPVAFSLEPHKLDTNVYFSALKHWTESHQAGAAFLGMMKLLELYRGTVLNPGSHSTPTTLNNAEIKAGIRTINFFSEVPNYGKSPAEIAGNLLAKPALADEERPLVAGYLRAAFMQKLRKFCQDRNLPLPFTMKPEAIPALDLWQVARPILAAENGTLVTNVEVHRALFIDQLTRPVALSLDKLTLQAAFQSVQLWA